MLQLSNPAVGQFGGSSAQLLRGPQQDWDKPAHAGNALISISFAGSHFTPRLLFCFLATPPKQTACTYATPQGLLFGKM